MSLTQQDLVLIRGVVVEVLTELVLPRLDRLEARMDRLEARMDAIEARLDKLEKRVTSLEIGLQEVNQRLYVLELRVGKLEEMVHDIKGRLKATENDVKDIYKMLNKRGDTFIGTPAYNAMSPKKKIIVIEGAVSALAAQLNVEFQLP